jgi:hypothetical protein
MTFNSKRLRGVLSLVTVFMSGALFRTRRAGSAPVIALDYCEHGDWAHYRGRLFPVNCLHAVGADVTSALDTS